MLARSHNHHQLRFSPIFKYSIRKLIVDSHRRFKSASRVEFVSQSSGFRSMGTMESESGTSDYLKFQKTVNTFLGMPLYVFTMDDTFPKLGPLLTVSYRYFIEMIVIVVTIGQFWAIPHVSDDMNILCGCLSSGSHCAQVVAKTTLLHIYKDQYLSHIRRVHALQKEIDAYERRVFNRGISGFPELHRKESKYVKIIVVIQLIGNFASTSAYFLPFVYDSIVNRSEIHRQVTPIVVYMGLDYHYTPLFQFVVITLMIGFYVSNLKTPVIDNFLLSLIVLHMSQLKHHNHLLVEIMKNRETGSGSRDTEMVRGWIKLHQDLLRSCDSLRDLISPYLFLEFSYILVHTCMPAFVITSTFSWTLPQKVAVFFIIGGALVALFFMSNAGDNFSDVWSDAGNALFQSDFSFKDEKWMRNTFLIIQKRVNRPFRLTALNIVPLSCNTFALILKLIFSYYMTLNQLQKLKHNDGDSLDGDMFPWENMN